MFRDSTGAISAMRVSMFLIVVTICTVYVFQNIVSVCHGHGLVSFGMTEVSAFGVVFAAKVGQNITENVAAKTDTEESTDTPPTK
jgi:hypothetical protein